nr:hypothetical protein [uncultured Pseudomonas sp.]
MSTQMQLRGGTTAENLLFTGAQREVTVDTDKNTLVVHDGVTPGGFTMASEDQVANSTYFYVDDISGGSAANAYILVPQANTNQPNSYQNGIILGFVTANANTGPSTANFQGLGVKNIKYPGGVDPSPGDISGRVTVVYDAGNGWLELQRKPVANLPQIRTLSASVASNALTITIPPMSIDFRSSSRPNGAVNNRVTTSNTTIVIPAGATLGTLNGVKSTIVVVAIDNAGTVELAVINLAGGVVLDESDVINSAAITAGSSSAITLYSTVARIAVPYRVIGAVISTQAAAGTWATAPSIVQGQGGQAIFQKEYRLYSGTSQATTSGTSVDFTGIPADAKRVTINLTSVSTNGTSPIMIQLGAGSVDAAGYLGAFQASVNGVAPVVGAFSNGFSTDTLIAAASVVHFSMVLSLVAGSVWVMIGTGSLSNTARALTFAGSKSLSGALDRIRITTVAGADIFDAGAANITWEN